jgi:UrcA family protein
MSKPFFGSVLLASMGAAIVLAAPASARTADKVSSEVRFGDLNLATDAGVTQLHRRIRTAAYQVCGRPEIRDLKGSQAAASCRDTALADARPKIELAIANARSGQDFAANTALEVGKPASR